MLWFFENPIPALAAGGFSTALAVVAWLQSGRRTFAAVAGLLLCLTVAAVVIEGVVVTPGEQVADRVHAIASALESNDPSRVIEYISPRAPDLRQQVATALQQVKIKDAAVKRDLRVETHGQGLATATFHGVVVADAPGRDIANYRHARLFVVKFRYEEGAWLVSGYEEKSPLAGSAEH